MRTRPILLNEVDVAIFALDADGAVYNDILYTKFLIKIIDEYWDFFKQCAEQEVPSFPEIEQKVKDMMQRLEEIANKKIDLHQSIWEWVQNESFRKKLFDLQNAIGDRQQSLSIILNEFICCMEQVDRDIMRKIFLLANEKIIKLISDLIRSGKFRKTALVISSNRQSHYHDQAGIEQNGTGSIYANLYDLKYAINYCVKEERQSVPVDQCQCSDEERCFVSEFSMADIYGNLKRGESYRKILDERYALLDNLPRNFSVDHAPYLFDEGKLSLVYGISHDAVLNILKELEEDQDKRIVIYILDDRLDILIHLFRIFSQYPQLLPKQVFLKFYLYNGLLADQPLGCIQGEGESDCNYRENIKLMAYLCGSDLLDFTEPVNMVKKLDIVKFLELRQIATISNQLQESTSKSFSFFSYKQEEREVVASMSLEL